MSPAPNRTQVLLLAFLVGAWLVLLILLLGAPDIVRAQLQVRSLDNLRSAELLLLAGVSAIVTLSLLGVLGRWRWVFWLLLLASLGGALRVPAAALQLAGVLPPPGPSWYVLVQALIGLVQCGIGVAMVAGYRRAGVWGAF